MNDELIAALQKFLADTFRDRTMCPRCVGYLPDRHNPDCTLGQLDAAYRKAQMPALQPVTETKAPIPTKTTGKKKSTQQTVAAPLF